VIEIPAGLPADLTPFAWLLGVWEGSGVIDYTAGEHRFSGEFGQRVSFSHDGGAFLNYSADAWTGEGDARTALVSEIGYWRLSRALVSQASAAQLPDAATPAAAAAAIARHDAALRHRARQPAAADPLPLLARASASLAALPPGALRAARYAGDTWTLEFGKLDPSVMSRVMRALHDAGIDALAAPTAAGTRMRLSLAATVR